MYRYGNSGKVSVGAAYRRIPFSTLSTMVVFSGDCWIQAELLGGREGGGGGEGGSCFFSSMFSMLSQA